LGDDIEAFSNDGMKMQNMKNLCKKYPRVVWSHMTGVFAVTMILSISNTVIG
jgi:hypothetical protein